ncbi:antitoxin [Pseudonocardia nigra]|uniref:antitoxin n=1 Tax=Pseudonocardia nigra TaxID=1921578 RepID=UPI001C5ECB0B|nr:antitoxin [Pseudonocardia nigra]
MGFMDKAKDLLNQHDDKVDQGLDKAGEAAKGRFAGHDEQIDQGVDRLQGMTGAGDTTQAPETPPQGAAPDDAVPDRPADGVEARPEVPGGPQVDVPAGPGHEPPPQR